MWKFGDIIRVDPAANPAVPQPDDRRWLILVPADTSAARPWLTLYLGPGSPGHPVPWPSMTGFARVEEDKS